MKKKIFVIFLLIFSSEFQTLFCQTSSTLDKYFISGNEPCLTGELFTSSSNVYPATYYNSQWLTGDIYLINGEMVRNKLIKYNGYLDELLWLETKSNNVVKLDKESIQFFHFQSVNGDTSIYFRRIKLKRNNVADSSEVFGEQIYSGILSLYVVHNYVLEGKEVVYKDGRQGEKNIYAEEPVYVLITKSNLFVTKSLKRNVLYKFFPANKALIKEYFSANQIGKFPSRAELIRLSQFLITIESN